MRRVGIIQPNYIPWRGFFDFISRVDVFVFFDDVQYTKRDWRNRNKVCTRGGDPVWLSVPVSVASRDQLIKDTPIKYDEAWIEKHLGTLHHSYGKAPFFDTYFPIIEGIYAKKFEMLVDLDIALTRQICDWLAIQTEFAKSSDLPSSGHKDEKLIAVAKAVGGTHYLSGPAAKAYMQDQLWEDAGIALEYVSYPDYPPYPQINPGFTPQVSVLDLLFMTGPDAPRYIWPDSEMKSA